MIWPIKKEGLDKERFDKIIALVEGVQVVVDDEEGSQGMAKITHDHLYFGYLFE